MSTDGMAKQIVRNLLKKSTFSSDEVRRFAFKRGELGSEGDAGGMDRELFEQRIAAELDILITSGIITNETEL